MPTPKVTRPLFPKGYVDHPTSKLPWSGVEEWLVESMHYWMCSVRPDGRPHAVPRWAVYLDGRIYYDGSPQTRHARNLEGNPNVSVHLESGAQAVILEGTSRPVPKPDRSLAQRLAQAYRAKYETEGYAPEPTQWEEGGLYVFTPRQCLAWTKFHEDPTKFVFPAEET